MSSTVLPESFYEQLPKRYRAGEAKESNKGFSKTLVQQIIEQHEPFVQSKYSSTGAVSSLSTSLPLDNLPEQFRAKGKDKAAERRERKELRKRKYLTSRERRKLNLLSIPTECRKFDLLLPLHQLWEQYMVDLRTSTAASGAGPSDQFLAKLVKADFHGALLTVVRATCPTRIGITGIVVQETSNTFKVVTRSNELKSVAKEGTVFSLAVKGTLYTLFGNQIRYRSSERAARKFKSKPTIDM
ncbi:RNase P/RNase MRP complex subunit [Blastocladiella emersonii ATCC 22665]|nr:RNase P/RNase MRP complex subunit [Blastocladiella emersonii ATCC 22665]